MMRKIVLIAGCLVLSVMSLFVFIASLGGLLAEDKELSIAIPLLVVSIVGFLLVFILAKKHIFSCKYDRNIQQDKNKNAINNKKLYTYEDIIRKEVMASDLFEDMYKEKIIKYQLQFETLHMKSPEFVPLGDDTDVLSLDEKKELGLNPRVKYQRHLTFLLTDKGLHYQNGNIKGILMLAVYKANSIINMQNSIIRFQGTGLKSMKVSIVDDERDCNWCLSMKNKVIPVSLDFVDDVLDNCTCEYPRLLVLPQIDY